MSKRKNKDAGVRFLRHGQSRDIRNQPTRRLADLTRQRWWELLKTQRIWLITRIYKERDLELPNNKVHHEQKTSWKAKDGIRNIWEEKFEKNRPAHQENERYRRQEGQRMAKAAPNENLMWGTSKESTFWSSQSKIASDDRRYDSESPCSDIEPSRSSQSTRLHSRDQNKTS